MPLLVGEPPSAILVDDDDRDGGPALPLPSWTLSHQLEPPTSSLRTRLEVFDAIDKGNLFDTFVSMNEFTPRKSMCCGICHQFLDEPAACSGCTFLACRECWRKHYAADRRCPACRLEQPLPNVAKHLLAILDEELEKNGVMFLCNAHPPGLCPHALWCCERAFGSLRDLREHLQGKGTFRHTRIRLTRLLKLSLEGNKDAQAELYDDPVKRSQLATVMEEDSVCLRISKARMMATGAQARSRSRSVRRRVLIDAPWRAPPTP